MIKGAIFDMDGLLADTEPLWQQAETEIFQELGAPLTKEMCKTMMGRRIDDVVSHWFKTFSINSKSEREVVLDIQDRMESLIREGITLLPGARECLEYFNDYNYKIALASSSAMQLINAVIETTGISKYFSVIRSGECEIHGKPHPAIFLTTLREMELKADEVVVLEDSFHGAIAAKAAKMKTILVPPKEDYDNPKTGFVDVKLKSLLDLKEDHL